MLYEFNIFFRLFYAVSYFVKLWLFFIVVFLKEFSNFCLTVSRNFFFAVLLDILLTYNKKDFLQFLVRESKTQQAVNYDKDNHKEKWMNL